MKKMVSRVRNINKVFVFQVIYKNERATVVAVVTAGVGVEKLV